MAQMVASALWTGTVTVTDGHAAVSRAAVGLERTAATTQRISGYPT